MRWSCLLRPREARTAEEEVANPAVSRSIWIYFFLFPWLLEETFSHHSTASHTRTPQRLCCTSLFFAERCHVTFCHLVEFRPSCWLFTSHQRGLSRCRQCPSRPTPRLPRTPGSPCWPAPPRRCWPKASLRPTSWACLLLSPRPRLIENSSAAPNSLKLRSWRWHSNAAQIFIFFFYFFIFACLIGSVFTPVFLRCCR